jgi:hypothetical protein
MTTKFIKIESKGIIDTQAFYLLGASSKRDDKTKIGFFGSGLKYSIAYLLRNKISFKVFSDYKEIKFSTDKINFREKEFDVIRVDDKETSMTTEMGIDWQAWFAIREIYCNAIDEGDSSISIVSSKKCVPVEDKTVFYIQITDEFKQIIDDWNYYFSDERKDILYSDDSGNQILSSSKGLLVYRKGIRCYYQSEEKCLFNYDFNWIDINESRTIKDEWQFKYKLVNYLKKIDNDSIIKHILNCIQDKWEKTLYWDNHEKFSENWLTLIGKKVLVPYENSGFWQDVIQENPLDYLILPSSLVLGLKNSFDNRVRVIGDVDDENGFSADFKPVKELNKKQNFLLNQCIDFLTKSNYEVKYPIIVGDFVYDKTLGQAKDEKIFLSQKVFELGRKEIVSTIFEENEHLKTKLSDETRAFQNHLINSVISLMEEKTNIYL